MIQPVPRPVGATTVNNRPVLSVSLDAVSANWRLVKATAPSAEAAAVVKANAYGLGAVAIARTLRDVGCETFFAATFDEACSVRAAVGAKPRIFVLNGLSPGIAAALESHALTPVLNTLADIREWSVAGNGQPCAIHIDTGMNRAGLGQDDVATLAGDRALLQRLSIGLIMSHLACSDDPVDVKNGTQRDRFKSALAKLPSAPASLAASGGVFLGPDYHFDLVRPGVALYGGNPGNGRNPMHPTMTLTADLLGSRQARAGETVGYGATFAVKDDRHLAVCNIGYADGLPRALSSRGIAFVDGVPCPYAGRVSMDLLTIDITNLPPSKRRQGTPVEIIGPNMTLETMADLAGTVHYEILTRLGQRFARVYQPA